MYRSNASSSIYRSNANTKTVTKYSFWYRFKYELQGHDCGSVAVVVIFSTLSAIMSSIFGVLPMVLTLIGVLVAFATAFLISVHKCVPYEG